MNDLIVLNNNDIAKNLTEYDEKMLNIYNYLGLPTENILVGVEERKKVFKNIEDVVDLLEPDIAIKSTYISKFLSAVSAGLFDAALNYLWDETVNQLRYRIAQYDIQYFFDLAVTSDKRNKLSTEADLVKIDDSELIQGAKEIGPLRSPFHQTEKESSTMPKLKTHSGAKKRFNLTKSGKVKRAHAFKSHLLNGHGKTTKRKRGLRAGAYADVTNESAIKRMIPYK